MADRPPVPAEPPPSHVWLGLAARQRAAFALQWTLVVQVSLVVANVGLDALTGSGLLPAWLYLGSVALSLLWFWFASGRRALELGPTTLLVPRPGLRRSRVVRWSSVLRVEVRDGRVRLDLPGEPPVVPLAPRAFAFSVRDPRFDAKAETLLAWWQERRDQRPVGPGGEAVDAAPEPEGAPLALVTLLVLFGITVVAGYLFTGPSVLVLAVALFVLLRFGRDPGRPLALAAFLLLVVAGLATILQDYPPAPALTFASRRSVAAETGAIVGVFLVLATLIFAVTERAPDPAPVRPVVRIPLGDWPAAVRTWVAGARAWLPYAVAGVVGLGCRLVLSPAPLVAGYDPLIANLRLATAYSLSGPNGAVPTGLYPPLTASLAAFAPLGPRLAYLTISIATMAAAAVLAHRWGGRRAGVAAVAVAALLPSLWGQQLANLTAALLVTLAVLAADPRRLTPRRAAVAGAWAGLAVLARPDAVVAVVVIGVWVLLNGRRTAGAEPLRGVGPVLAFLATALVATAPWIGFVTSAFGFPWLAETVGALLNDPGARTRLPGAANVVVGGALAAAALALGAPCLPRRLRLPVVALPAACLLLTVTEPFGRDPSTWSAGLVAALGGIGVASLLERRAARRAPEPTLAER